MKHKINRCESCGPMLRKVYPKDGTYWCKLCFQAEGWKLPKSDKSCSICGNPTTASTCSDCRSQGLE